MIRELNVTEMYDVLQVKIGTLEETVNELQALIQFKQDFISKVSHDLRTPITAIKGGLDLLEMGTFGSLNPQQQELIDMAQQGIQRLLSCTEQLLDYAKLETRDVRAHTEETIIHSR